MAYPTPNETFAHDFIVQKNSDGSFTVAGGAGPGAYVVSDNVPDGAMDKATQLGDVSNDRFKTHGISGTSEPTYVGQTSNGIIGKQASVNFPGRYFNFLYTNASYSNGAAITGVSSAPFDITCFTTGTLIRAICDSVATDVPVEHLAVGDTVVTPSGTHRPIRWIGHRSIDSRRHPNPARVFPIRTAAHAFGPGRPARDLFLSPGHPVLVGADEDGAGGHLVPIMCLINGTTIERVAVDEVTYWHIELDEHDILLAEGLPAESYIDLGSRKWFAGADGALYDPDMALPGMPGRCRPVAIDGPIVKAERRRLDTVFAAHLAAMSRWPTDESLSLSL